MAAPVAAFSADQLVVFIGTEIFLTDESTNTPTSWLREVSADAGANRVSIGTTQNTSIIPSSAADLSIRLTATNDDGSDDETKIDYVHVLPPLPVAEFSADILSGDEPLTVQFTDLSTNTPTSRSWELSSDGLTWAPFSANQNQEYIFTIPGIYSVRLTATNDFGYSSEQKDNYITVTTSDVPPVADFTFIPDPAIPAAAPIHIEFTDTSTGGTGEEWVWDYRLTGGGILDPWTNFNYGTDPLINQNPVADITDVPGVYDVRLTVRNGGGTQSSEKITTGVFEILPELLGTATATPTTGNFPLDVQFEATISGGVPPYTYDWAFSDGQTSTIENPLITFLAEETITTQLTVTDSALQSISVTVPDVTVLDPVTTEENYIIRCKSVYASVANKRRETFNPYQN